MSNADPSNLREGSPGTWIKKLALIKLVIMTRVSGFSTPMFGIKNFYFFYLLFLIRCVCVCKPKGQGRLRGRSPEAIVTAVYLF